MPSWPNWNERRNRSIKQNAREKAPTRPDSRKDPREVLGGELRGWIERVIVPILVEQYLREKGLNQEQTDG